MSSVNSDYLSNKINSSNLDLSNTEKTLESTKDGLFELSSITSGGDSFISTTKEADISALTGETSASSSEDDIDKQIEQYEAQIEKLEQQIQEYETQIQNLNTRLEAEKANLAQINQNLTTSQSELDELQTEYNAKEEQYAEINAAIEKATSNAETQAAQKQQTAIYEAMANYNEEEDGDYNTYMQEALKGVMSDSSISTLIANLSSESTSLASELGDLKMNISSKTSQVQSFQTQATSSQANVTALEGQINNVETFKTTSELEKTQTQDKITNVLMSQLSEGEKCLIKQHNIDLTEKMSDGSARYIFAKAEDGKYHVYDMVPTDGYYKSLARKYLGYSDESYNIIPCGSGEMFVDQYNEITDGTSGKKVYYMNECGEIGTKQACYQTCSPLSFDLNGDGVKTSDKLIKYDIDGDGKLDTINDSADAILVFDADGDGISGEDGSECFGNNTDLDGDGIADGYKDGFEALKALADKEGLINGKDDYTLDINDLKILEEKYGLQIKTDGYNSEGKSLFDAGISEINLAQTDETTLNKNYDGQYNDLMTQEGATFVVNGEEREYADIWHAKKDE